MNKAFRIVATLAVAAIGATGCGFEHTRETLVSTTAPSTSPDPGGSAGTPSSGNNAGTLVGTWASPNADFTLPDISTCGNFQWQISNQTETSIAGSFTAVCGGSLTIQASGTGNLASPTTVNLAVTGAALVGGYPVCTFDLTSVSTIVDPDTLLIPYTGTTCLGPVSGTETLRRRSTAPPPPAAPIEEPPPPPSSDGPNGFNLAAVTVVGSPNILSWPVTSRITSLGFSPGNIHLDHTRRCGWPPVVIAPDGTTQEATLWVFFNINGRWYGTGAERWRPCQTDKALGQPSHIGPGWLYDPSRWGVMTNYVPRPGEMVGFMVAAGSTRSDANAPVAERSAVVMVPFPADNTTTYFPPFAWEE